MVDHENRNAVAQGSHPDDESFPPVEGNSIDYTEKSRLDWARCAKEEQKYVF